MRKTALFLAGALVLPALLVGCASSADPAGVSPVPAESAAISAAPEETSSGEPGGILSSFTASDLEGNEVDASLFEDYELTMVNVWATYCNPCLSEMPGLGELAAQYDPEEFQIIGIVSDVMEGGEQETLDQAEALIQETGADYTHLLLNESVYYALLTGVSAVPTTFFVDESGTILDTVVGAMEKEDWEERIDGYLAQL